jgi:GTPase SAR1 family protein
VVVYKFWFIVTTMSSSNNASNSPNVSNTSTSILGINNNANQPTVVHRKVAVLGYRAVGKTSLVNMFVAGAFSEQYEPTIESSWTKTIRFRKVGSLFVSVLLRKI